MASNVDGLIREGVAALKAGHKEEARKLLTRATQLDERNEEAWLWLSAAVDTLEKQQLCLENVIAINPNNTRALQGLEALKRQTVRRQPPSPQPSQPASPFDLAASAPGSQARAADAPAASAQDPFSAAEQPTSAFHGSGQNVQLPSQSEYDDWVDGLNLGSKSAAAPPSDLGGNDPFGFDGPFQPAALPSDPFTASIDEVSAAPEHRGMVSPGQEAGDFSGGYDSFDPFAPPQSTYPSSFDDEAVVADGGQYSSADPFGGLGTGEGGFSSASPFAEEELDSADAVQDANDLLKFLDYIPEGIVATHLPGQVAVYPRSLLIALVAVSGGLVLSLIVMAVLLISR